MKTLKKLLLLAIVAATAFTANAGVLYWQLSSNPNKDDYAALVVFKDGDKFAYAPIVNEENGDIITYTPTTADAMSNSQAADISDYSGSAYSFAIETLSVKDGQWKEGWITSSPLSYDEALESGYISVPGIDAGSVNTWTASVQVPEPTSGLLLLVGGSLLALRRRRRA